MEEKDEKEKKKQQHIENKEKELNDYYLGLCIGFSALLALCFLAIYFIGIVNYINEREDVNDENKKKYKIICGVVVFVIYVIGTYFIVDALIKERDKNIAITKTDLKKIATI